MNFRFTLTTSFISGFILKDNDEPVGWDTAQLTLKRDTEKYHGLFFGFTTSLTFVGAAFQLLSQEFGERGLDGYCLVQIAIDCGSGYTTVYTGQLDFSSYKATNNAGCSCSIDITESNIEVLTTNRQDILTDLEETVSIDGYDMSGNSLFDLLMHNYTLNFSGQWKSEETASSGLNPDINNGLAYFIQLHNPECIGFDEIGGMTDCSTNGDVYLNSSLPPSSALADLVTIFTAPRSDTYNFSYSLFGTVFENSNQSRTASQSFLFGKKDSFGTVTSIEDVYTFGFYARSGANTFDQDFDKTNTFSVFLLAGEKILLRCSWANYTLTTGSGTFTSNFQLTLDSGSFIRVAESSTYPATYARASYVYDAFWKAMANYTGSKDALYSLVLGYPSSADNRGYQSFGCAAYTAVTNGYKIRGFPDKKIFVSLTDLFDSLDAKFNLGAGFEIQSDNVVRFRIEEKEFFYSNATLLAIFTDVQEIVTTTLPAMAYNRFQLGFEQFKVEEGTDKLNTNDEFLTQFTWTTASKSIKNVFTRFSKYISSLYVIEYTRRNRYTTGATKESKYDETNFLIAMNRSGLQQAEKDEAFTNVDGIVNSNEAYNLRFNLFSTLIRWSNIFNASITRMVDKTLKFTFGSLNNDVTMEYSPTEQCEGNYSNQQFITNQDLGFDDTNNDNRKPIYEPIEYSFTYPLSFAEYNRMRRYPQGTIIFGRDLESLIQGFILEVNYRPVEGLADFRLLRSYEQNIGLFFPVMPTFEDLKRMGVIVDYYGTLSIFDDTGLGSGVYDGFALCNGQNGTPDLRSKFIVSYDPDNADYNELGKTGGVTNVTLTSGQSGQKDLGDVEVRAQLNTVGQGGGGTGVSNATNTPSYSEIGFVTINGQDADEPHENRPPFYVLAKVMFIGT